MSTPPATTATVPTASAASCAAASMPRARPETTTRPAKPSSRARVSANLRARAEALRAPTMAIISFCSRCGWPSTLITGGGASSAASPCGYSGSQDSEHAPAQRRQRSSSRAMSLSSRQYESLAAAAPRQARHFVQRRRRRTEARDQIVEGDRPDILGARQPQPGAAFAVAESHASRWLWLRCAARCRSSSRRIFSRCMTDDQQRQQQRQRGIAVLAATAGNRPATARWRSAPTGRRCARRSAAPIQSPPPADPPASTAPGRCRERWRRPCRP